MDFVDRDADDPLRTRVFRYRSCPNEHVLEIEEIEPRTFSFNAPYGSCPDCDGIGYTVQVSEDLVIGDEDHLDEGAIIPWSTTASGPARDYHMHASLRAWVAQLGFDLNTKWKDIPREAQDAILNGHNFKGKDEVPQSLGARKGIFIRPKVCCTSLNASTGNELRWSRRRYEGFMREVTCQTCGGARLRQKCSPCG